MKCEQSLTNKKLLITLYFWQKVWDPPALVNGFMLCYIVFTRALCLLISSFCSCIPHHLVTDKLARFCERWTTRTSISSAVFVILRTDSEHKDWLRCYFSLDGGSVILLLGYGGADVHNLTRIHSFLNAYICYSVRIGLQFDNQHCSVMMWASQFHSASRYGR